jgi:hypothetical protein
MNERMRRGVGPHFSTLCHDYVKRNEEEEEKTVYAHDLANLKVR